jgi:hypothetical protein
MQESLLVPVEIDEVDVLSDLDLFLDGIKTLRFFLLLSIYIALNSLIYICQYERLYH